MNIYESRWNNAVRWARAVNAAVARGLLVRIDGGDVGAPLEITDRRIFLPFSPGTGSGIVLFINDVELDNGMHTTIGGFNAAHPTRCYAPVPLASEGVDP